MASNQTCKSTCSLLARSHHRELRPTYAMSSPKIASCQSRTTSRWLHKWSNFATSRIATWVRLSLNDRTKSSRCHRIRMSNRSWKPGRSLNQSHSHSIQSSTLPSICSISSRKGKRKDLCTLLTCSQARGLKAPRCQSRGACVGAEKPQWQSIVRMSRLPIR